MVQLLTSEKGGSQNVATRRQHSKLQVLETRSTSVMTSVAQRFSEGEKKTCCKLQTCGEKQRIVHSIQDGNAEVCWCMHNNESHKCRRHKRRQGHQECRKCHKKRWMSSKKWTGDCTKRAPKKKPRSPHATLNDLDLWVRGAWMEERHAEVFVAISVGDQTRTQNITMLLKDFAERSTDDKSEAHRKVIIRSRCGCRCL